MLGDLDLDQPGRHAEVGEPADAAMGYGDAYQAGFKDLWMISE